MTVAVVTAIMIALTVLQVNIVLIGLAVTGIVMIACIAFFLRMRMNRMLKGMEGRLARQQAAQFDNLSKRLEVLEEYIEHQAKSK